MTIRTWRRLAVVASVFNAAGAAFAIAAGEGWHAGIHVSLALGFGFAAQRLGQIDRQGTGAQAAVADGAQLDDMQAALSRQAAQIAELEERVDFAERMLAQVRDREKLGS